MESLKILSIDDSRGVHAYVNACFDGTAHKVSHAMSGKEGLDKLTSEPFDLVLLDWEMPEMTGPEVLAEIKKRGLKIPVVMLTSKNSPSDILRLLNEGAAEYIMKPFTPDILFEKLSVVLGRKIA